MTITIKYVEGETVAFIINNQLFYLRQGPGVPQIFDENLKAQIIPNIDNWFQAKTQQRYSYKSVCDMAAAFAAGLQHSYTNDDLVWVIKRVVNATVKTIFQTDHAREFSRAYWVELMDPGKLLKLVEYIRSDFSSFSERYEPEELYNVLCRLWQFSNFYAPSESAIFETMIRTHLKRVPQSPRYPDTSNTDQEIEKLRSYLGEGVSTLKEVVVAEDASEDSEAENAEPPANPEEGFQY